MRRIEDAANMKAETKRKIWLGVGAFIVVGTGAAGGASAGEQAQATIQPPSAGRSSAHILIAQYGEHDREAGEAGESKTLAKLPPALAFATRIALLRGHLLIGDELVKLQQWNAALPHFLHPGEEIYADIKDELGQYKVPPFDAALKALAGVVKAKKGGDAYSNALKNVNAALAAADAGLKDKQDDWPGFVVETAVEALKMATGEYQQAIVAGRIAKPVEYQDARGFVWQASGMIESVAAELANKDASALQGVRAGLAELKLAFPTAMPPKVPVKDTATVLGDVARIELAAGKLM
jgi:hypothetical protein